MNSLEILKSEGIFRLNGHTYPLSDIKHIRIMNEDAKYKGKTRPFSHQVLGGVTMVLPVGNEPSFYVGLRITLKDDTDLHYYVSQKPVRNNTDGYHLDKQKAEKLKKELLG